MAASVARRRAATEANAPPAAKRAKTSSQSSHDILHKKGLEAAVFTNSSGQPLTAKVSNGLKTSKSHRIDEARAVISKADKVSQISEGPKIRRSEAIEISSDSSSSEGVSDDGEEDDDEEEEEHEDVLQLSNGISGGKDKQRRPNGTPQNDSKDSEDGESKTEQVNADEDDVDAADDVEPSFGELLQSHVAAPIDVEASFDNAERDLSSLISHSRRVVAPSASSLGTVLTQALRTNDRDLLESCFEMNDLDSVRSTIERLPSPLVATLLHKLAERMHKRPGRAGSLMVWVQWTLVSHGGFLASQPDVISQLGSLNRVIKERANGLQPLLALKGKLDMLSAQLELRRALQDQARGGAEQDEDEDEAVIYVEGEEDEVSEEDDSDAEASTKLHKRGGDDIRDAMDMDGLAQTQEFDQNSSDADEDDDDGESEDASGNDEEASQQGFSDEEQQSEEDEDESQDEDAPRTKHSLASRSGFGR